MLNKKQQLFFAEIQNKKNTLLTGSAGTGKSYCIKKVIEELLEKEAPFGVTATTGIAALTIGGSTVHSWCGIGLGEESAEYLVNKIRSRKHIRDRIKKTKVLIIDEISMMSGELLEKIDYIFKKIKCNSLPFGGIQMIFSGDFCQLPPVSKGSKAKFAFETDAWKNANIQTVQLDELVRQKDDGEFGRILNDIRLGKSEAAEELIGNDFEFPDDGIKPIILYCLNKFVDTHNETEMKKLSGVEKKFFCETKGAKDDLEIFKKTCPAPDTLTLKVGAQVILLKNADQDLGLVNGSLGVVHSFQEDSVVVKFESGLYTVTKHAWEMKKQSIGEDNKTKFKVAASITQIPLKLAYSITCHKSQGLTLSRVILDATGAFEDGMIYTALSRVEKRQNIKIKNLNIERITANEKALQFYGHDTPKKFNDDPFDW